MTIQTDITFDGSCAFGSERWVARTLGVPLDYMYRHRAKLEAEGFPAKDGLLGRTNKADVQAWIERRRRLSDAVRAATPAVKDQPKENIRAL